MTTYWERYTEDHARTVDTMTAALLFAAFLFGSEIRIPGDHQPAAVGPTITLAAIASAALFWQRTHPRTVVAVTTVCSAGGSALGHILTPLLLGQLMYALYRLAVQTDRQTTRVYFLGSLALLVATAVAADPADHPWPLKTLGPAAWLMGPVAAGSATRIRGAYFEAVQARAEYAERGREEEARHRVAEERMRIARELHDVVAHHLALANAQAGTAAHLARTHPDQVQKILKDLAGTTSSALREMKATVGLLRQTDDPAAPLAPSPGLGQLSELTDAFGSAGLTVDVIVEGAPQPLSPGVDLTAFRIVQEALTNVTKHAGAKAAYVRLRYSEFRLTITVTDDGTSTAPAAPAPGRGFGLIGMGERARSVGGALQAGHLVEGGFEVTTQLPLSTTAPEPEVQNS